MNEEYQFLAEFVQSNYWPDRSVQEVGTALMGNQGAFEDALKDYYQQSPYSNRQNYQDFQSSVYGKFGTPSFTSPLGESETQPMYGREQSLSGYSMGAGLPTVEAPAPEEQVQFSQFDPEAEDASTVLGDPTDNLMFETEHGVLREPENMEEYEEALIKRYAGLQSEQNQKRLNYIEEQRGQFDPGGLGQQFNEQVMAPNETKRLPRVGDLQPSNNTTGKTMRLIDFGSDEFNVVNISQSELGDAMNDLSEEFLGKPFNEASESEKYVVQRVFSSRYLPYEVGEKILNENGLGHDVSALGHIFKAGARGMIGIGLDTAESFQRNVSPETINRAGSFMPGDIQTNTGLQGQEVDPQDVRARAENTRTAVNQALRLAPDYMDSFWMTDVPQGVGSMAGIIAGGGGTPLGSSIVGGASMGNSMYREAIQMGADEEAAKSAEAWGSAIGLSEGLPLMGLAKRVRRIGSVKPSMMPKVPNPLTTFGKTWTAQAVEEGAQEFFSSVGQNLTAREYYDFTREVVTPESIKEGMVGFVLGGMMGFTPAVRTASRQAYVNKVMGDVATLRGGIYGSKEGMLLRQMDLAYAEGMNQGISERQSILQERIDAVDQAITNIRDTTPEGQTPDFGDRFEELRQLEAEQKILSQMEDQAKFYHNRVKRGERVSSNNLDLLSNQLAEHRRRTYQEDLQTIEQAEGLIMNYQGVVGRVEQQADGTYSIIDASGIATPIESAESGIKPREMGLTPVKHEYLNHPITAISPGTSFNEDATPGLGSATVDVDGDLVTVDGQEYLYEGVVYNDNAVEVGVEVTNITTGEKTRIMHPELAEQAAMQEMYLSGEFDNVTPEEVEYEAVKQGVEPASTEQPAGESTTTEEAQASEDSATPSEVSPKAENSNPARDQKAKPKAASAPKSAPNTRGRANELEAAGDLRGAAREMAGVIREESATADDYRNASRLYSEYGAKESAFLVLMDGIERFPELESEAIEIMDTQTLKDRVRANAPIKEESNEQQDTVTEETPRSDSEVGVDGSSDERSSEDAGRDSGRSATADDGGGRATKAAPTKRPTPTAKRPTKAKPKSKPAPKRTEAKAAAAKPAPQPAKPKPKSTPVPANDGGGVQQDSRGSNPANDRRPEPVRTLGVSTVEGQGVNPDNFNDIDDPSLQARARRIHEKGEFVSKHPSDPMLNMMVRVKDPTDPESTEAYRRMRPRKKGELGKVYLYYIVEAQDGITLVEVDTTNGKQKELKKGDKRGRLIFGHIEQKQREAVYEELVQRGAELSVPIDTDNFTIDSESVLNTDDPESTLDELEAILTELPPRTPGKSELQIAIKDMRQMYDRVLDALEANEAAQERAAKEEVKQAKQEKKAAVESRAGVERLRNMSQLYNSALRSPRMRDTLSEAQWAKIADDIQSGQTDAESEALMNTPQYRSLVAMGNNVILDHRKLTIENRKARRTDTKQAEKEVEQSEARRKSLNAFKSIAMSVQGGKKALDKQVKSLRSKVSEQIANIETNVFNADRVYETVADVNRALEEEMRNYGNGQVWDAYMKVSDLLRESGYFTSENAKLFGFANENDFLNEVAKYHLFDAEGAKGGLSFVPFNHLNFKMETTAERVYRMWNNENGADVFPDMLGKRNNLHRESLNSVGQATATGPHGAPLQGTVHRNPYKFPKVPPISPRKVMLPRKIIGKLQRELKQPVLNAKSAFASILGTYNIKSGGIKISNHNDLVTFAHEVGHALDDQYQITMNANPGSPLFAELMELAGYSMDRTVRKASQSNQSRNQKLALLEGLAIWMEGMILNPEMAITLYPAVAARYESAVPAGERSHMFDFGENVRAFLTSPANVIQGSNIEPILDTKEKVGFREFMTRAFGAEGYISTGASAALGWLNQKFFDQMHHVNKAMTAAVHGKGFQLSDPELANYLPPSQNTRILIRGYLGFPEKFQMSWVEGFRNADGRPVLAKDGSRMTIGWLLGAYDSSTPETMEQEANEAMILGVNERAATRFIEYVYEQAVKKDRFHTNNARDLSMSNSTDALDQRLNGVEDVSEQLRIAFDFALELNGPRSRGLSKAQKAQSLIDLNVPLTGKSAGSNQTDVEAIQEVLDYYDNMKHGNPMERSKHGRLKDGISRYGEFADMTMKYLVDKGRYSKDVFDRIKAKPGSYVAMHRVFEAIPDTWNEIINQINPEMVRTNEVIQSLAGRKGGTQTIINPYHQLMAMTMNRMQEADRNEIIRSFVDIMIPPDRQIHSGSIEEAKANTAIVFDVTTATKDRIKSGMKPKDAGDNVVKVFRNGQEEYYYIDPMYKRQLEHMYKAVFKIHPLVTWLPRTMKSLITYAPPFAVRNIVRDTMNRLGGISDTDPLFSDIFVKEDGANFEELLLSGGGQAGWYKGVSDAWYAALNVGMRRLAEGRDVKFMDIPFTTSGSAATRKHAGDVLGKVRDAGRWYKHVMRKSEMVNRIAEFRSAKRKALKAGLSDQEASLYAMYKSRDLIDFSIGGEWAMVMNQITPFFNAALQSTAKLARSARRDPGYFMKRNALWVILPSIVQRLIVAAVGGDEEEKYRQMPAWRRDLFWQIPVGGGKWAAIPKPYEVGLIGSMVERAVSQAFLGEEGSFTEGEWIKSVMSTMVPGSATNFAPLAPGVIEVAINRDLFRGRDIVPNREEDMDVSERPTTYRGSALGEGLGSVLEYSGVVNRWADPRNIDHIIKRQFGYFGKWATMLSDFGFADDRPSLANPSENTQWISTALLNGAGEFVGLMKNDPSIDARDVNWFMEMDKRHRLSERQPAIYNYIFDTYGRLAASPNLSEKQKLAAELINVTSELRDAIEDDVVPSIQMVNQIIADVKEEMYVIENFPNTRRARSMSTPATPRIRRN